MTRIKTAGETRATWIEICKSYTLLSLTHFMIITLNTILALSHIQISIFLAFCLFLLPRGQRIDGHEQSELKTDPLKTNSDKTRP